MDVAPADAIRGLIDLLTTLMDVFRRQEERAELARQAAEETRARFDARVASYIQGKGKMSDPAPLEGVPLNRLSPGAIREDIRESARLSVLWESSFCDAYEALMRLCAFPEARDTAERIARLLRSVRMLQVEHLDQETAGPPHLPDIAPIGPDEDRRARLAGFAMEFLRGMDARRDKALAAYRQNAEQTEELLREALELARTLAP